MSEPPELSTPTPSLVRQALSIPNLITYARMAAIPAVMAIMQADSPMNAVIASVVFAIAAITDAVDGYVARRLNQVSIIGKFLDPLADKLIVVGVLVMLIQLGRVSPWIVFIIVSREMVITTLRSIAIGEGIVIAARALGKWKTGFQMTGLCALIVHYDVPLVPIGLPGDIGMHALGTGLLWISVVFSLLSAADYFVGFVRSLRAREAARSMG